MIVFVIVFVGLMVCCLVCVWWFVGLMSCVLRFLIAWFCWFVCYVNLFLA